MSEKIAVFVGTYTEDIRFGTGEVLKAKGEGIHVFAYDPDAGLLEPARTVAGVVNPSYLCLSGDNAYLYAVNELKEYEGRPSGSVSSFRVSPGSMELELIGRQPTGGADPCHVRLNPAGSHAFVSNFLSGSVCVYPVQANGALGPASHLVQHRGSSVDPRRQAGPHAHSLTFDQSGRFAFVPDLGLDKVMIYAFDQAAGRLDPVGSRSTPPGSGPRHFAFHPSGRFAFLINELSSTMILYGYDPDSAALEELQTVSTLPKGCAVENTCADVHVHPSGRFVYGSNRGHDSLSVHAFDEAAGRLEEIGFVDSGGRTPRNFALDPAGRHLLAANQDSDRIGIFRLDDDSGMPEPIGDRRVPTPVCVRFAWAGETH